MSSRFTLSPLHGAAKLPNAAFSPSLSGGVSDRPLELSSTSGLLEASESLPGGTSNDFEEGSPMMPSTNEDLTSLTSLKAELKEMGAELKRLEHEQRVSNERQLAMARRRIREKKKSEIARRLIEAQRLQVVLAQKQEEEEERKKQVSQFHTEMTSRAETHIKAAGEHRARLFKVLGLRRIPAAEQAELEESEEEEEEEEGARTSLERVVARPADTMVKQRSWMKEQVMYAVNRAKALAQSEEEARKNVSVASDSHEESSPLRQLRIRETQTLQVKNREVCPELTAARQELRAMGVDISEAPKKLEQREPLLIREGKEYTLDRSRRFEERIHRALERQEEKEQREQLETELTTAGEHSTDGDQCVRNGVLLRPTSEENQQLARLKAQQQQRAHPYRAMILSPHGLLSPREAGLEGFDSEENTPHTHGRTPSTAGFRLEATDAQQRANDRQALLQAQQQEKFVTGLRDQQEALHRLKGKLKALEETDAAQEEDEGQATAPSTLTEEEAGDDDDEKRSSVSSRPTTEAAVQQEREVAARSIQYAFLSVQSREKIKTRREEKDRIRKREAALSIQQMWFSVVAKREAEKRKEAFDQHHLKTLEREAATAIQARWKGYAVRRKRGGG